MKSIMQAVFVTMLTMGVSGSLNAQHVSPMSESTTVELTSFKLIDGEDESKFIEVARKMQSTFLDAQDGFVCRTLVRDEDLWTDIVYWRDADSMKRAMKKAESSLEVLPFIKMINLESIEMNITEIQIHTK